MSMALPNDFFMNPEDFKHEESGSSYSSTSITNLSAKNLGVPSETPSVNIKASLNKVSCKLMYSFKIVSIVSSSSFNFFSCVE